MEHGHESDSRNHSLYCARVLKRLRRSCGLIHGQMPHRLQGVEAVGALVDGDEDMGHGATVVVWVMSVPHKTSTASVMMVPSCV